MSACYKDDSVCMHFSLERVTLLLGQCVFQQASIIQKAIGMYKHIFGVEHPPIHKISVILITKNTLIELNVRREKRDEIETVKTVSSLDDKKQLFWAMYSCHGDRIESGLMPSILKTIHR